MLLLLWYANLDDESPIKSEETDFLCSVKKLWSKSNKVIQSSSLNLRFSSFRLFTHRIAKGSKLCQSDFGRISLFPFESCHVQYKKYRNYAKLEFNRKKLIQCHPAFVNVGKK